MALFNNFPWTNFHELNLDWIVKQVKEIQAAFPEGLVGVPKGGTGADNAADARANLGIYASEIDMAPDDSRVISLVMGYLEDQIGEINYRIFKTVQDLGLTPGSVSIPSTWTAMSSGDVVLCPPDEFAPGACPESYGTLMMIRSGGNSGCCLFFGANHQYRINFVSNYPSGTWEQIYTDADIIPITNGGTGADNAADAIQNLGIDFSGTVLSVAGVGADPTGNVPLKLNNLMFNALSELGLASGSTLVAVWTALPDNSLLIANAAEISDPPVNDAGSLEVYKGTSTTTGFIRFHGKESSTGDYVMYLNMSGMPSGIWIKVLDTSFSTAQCTTNYSTVLNQLVKWGPFVILKLRITKTSNSTAAIATIPQEYRPATPQFLRVGTYPQGGSTPDVIPVDISTDGLITTRQTFEGEVTINLVYEH